MRKARSKQTNNAVVNTAARWHGAVEGMHQHLLYGWAVDTQQPQVRVAVEICINGDAFGCILADVARTDIADCFEGDVCHGFVADLSALVHSDSGVITARIANTSIVLDGHVALDKPTAAPAPAINQVFSDGALRVHGWAIDPKRPGRTLTVRAYLGAELLATATAAQPHAGTRAVDAGPHGFTLDLPLSLADGKAHEVRVLDEDGHVLNGSPVTVCCYGAGGKALLAEAVGDATPASLLSALIDNYERYLPRSVSFAQYAAWSQHFDAVAPVAETSRRGKKSAAPHPSVAVIITGDGDYAATVESLDQQVGARAVVFSARNTGKKAYGFPRLLQQAIAAGTEAITCVRAGDTLKSNALVLAMQGFTLPGVQVVYTDSAIQHDAVEKPWFKPAWNPEYALCTDYPLELMLVRTELVKTRFSKLKQADLPQNAASFAWTMLGQLWEQGSEAIAHVPHVLYRFESALADSERSERHDAAQSALQQHEPETRLHPLNVNPMPSDFAPRTLRRVLTKQQRTTSVSLLIPTRDHAPMLKRCIESLRLHTDWPNLEIIVIDNGSVEQESKDYFRSLGKQGIRVLPMPGPFNFSDLNNRAVDAAKGDIVGLINNDIEALHAGWLDEILSHLLQPNVGAVGAKLLWPNGMVQHGGVLLGVGNVAGHFGNTLADTDWGDHGRNQLTQQVSGVTAACLFLRKSDYLAVGGMDQVAFPVAFNDVDLCLKLRAQGKAVIWTPNARLMHAESASRGHEDTPQKRARAQREVEQLRKRWSKVLLNDPAYHPSLNLDVHAQAFGGLALPPRKRTPRLAVLEGAEK